jgi:hypothetical protein
MQAFVGISEGKYSWQDLGLVGNCMKIELKEVECDGVN